MCARCRGCYDSANRKAMLQQAPRARSAGPEGLAATCKHGRAACSRKPCAVRASLGVTRAGTGEGCSLCVSGAEQAQAEDFCQWWWWQQGHKRRSWCVSLVLVLVPLVLVVRTPAPGVMLHPA